MSEPIGQTTTTSLIRLVLAAYPERKWDEIERTRSASAIDRFFGGGGDLLLHKLIPAPTGSCWVSPSLLNPGLRPELYEAETRPTYGSGAEPHPSSNGAA